MSHRAKIIWVVVMGLVATLSAVVVTIVFIARHMVILDPARIRAVSAKIAAYTVPPGYREAYALDLYTQEVVLKSTEKQNPRIYLLQRPAKSPAAKPDLMQKALLKVGQKIYRCGRGDYAQAGSETVTFRGSPSVLTTSENDSCEEIIREKFVTFNGNQGLAALMVIGPKSRWNEDLVRDFVASIH